MASETAMAKVFKVDNVNVTVFGEPIDGLISFEPPQANNRSKDAVETVEGVVGYSSKIIAGDAEFKITAFSSKYQWLCGLTDDLSVGTIVFNMPGRSYEMINATISEVKADSVKDSVPEVTVKILFTRVITRENSYE